MRREEKHNFARRIGGARDWTTRVAVQEDWRRGRGSGKSQTAPVVGVRRTLRVEAGHWQGDAGEVGGKGN